MSILDRLEEAPDIAHGTPSGLGDWRLSVQALLPIPGSSSLWGTAVWGDDIWTLREWVDLTPWVRGVEWDRGGDQPYGRPRVGELRLTLDSANDRWNPWNPSPPEGSPGYFAAGTFVRVGLRSDTDTRADGWLPQITVKVDRWTPVYSGAAADRFVDVIGYETVRDLATVDANALDNPVPSQYAADRFLELLDAADWRYGFNIEAGNLYLAGAYTLQPTNMADNRLAELYRTADSSDVLFRSDRKGRALATNIEYVYLRPGGVPDPEHHPLFDFSYSGGFPTIGFDWYARTVGTYRYVPYDVDSFTTTNDDASIINDARFARAGGSVQKFEQHASIKRHGRRTWSRTDFLNELDSDLALLAQYATIRRGLNALRVANVTVQVIDRGTEEGLIAAAADVQASCYVFPPDRLTGGGAPRPYIWGFLSGISHKITARNGHAVTWEASFSVDTRTVNRIPSAQLPATPA